MYKTYSTLSVQATVSDVFRRRRYNESYVNTCVSPMALPVVYMHYFKQLNNLTIFLLLTGFHCFTRC